MNKHDRDRTTDGWLIILNINSAVSTFHRISWKRKSLTWNLDFYMYMSMNNSLKNPFLLSTCFFFIRIKMTIQLCLYILMKLIAYHQVVCHHNSFNVINAGIRLYAKYQFSILYIQRPVITKKLRVYSTYNNDSLM